MKPQLISSGRRGGTGSTSNCSELSRNAASPTISIVPGPPAVWKAVLPTLRRPHEPFRLSLKAEDAYGNPSDQVDTELKLIPSLAVEGLAATCRFSRGERALVLEDLRVSEETVLDIEITDASGNHLARSNPMTVLFCPVTDAQGREKDTLRNASLPARPDSRRWSIRSASGCRRRLDRARDSCS